MCRRPRSTLPRCDRCSSSAQPQRLAARSRGRRRIAVHCPRATCSAAPRRWRPAPTTTPVPGLAVARLLALVPAPARSAAAGSSVAVATRVAWWWKCLAVLIGFDATRFASGLSCGEVLASLVGASLECMNIFNSEPGCPGVVSLSCAAAALTAKANTAPAVTMRMLSMSVLHRSNPSRPYRTGGVT